MSSAPRLPRSFQRTTLAQVLLSACLSGGPALLPAVAQAQEAADTAQAAVHDYNIPAGPLDRALNRFASRASLILASDGALTAGKTSPGLVGRFTVSEGLRRLLAGTGLTFRQQDHTVILERVVAATRTDEPAELEVVTVVGEKVARPLERTLSSVAVATASDLDDHGDQTLTDVMLRTPGVYAQSGNENWGIRGVPVSGFDSQGAATMNGAVTVFVDGAPQPHRLVTLNPLNLWDAEQVEIYRGAQSTTQGRNSLAGAIVLKTKDPSYKPEFAAQANAGNYGKRGASALANGAIVDGKVAARLAVDCQTEDGYIDNTTLGTDANPARNVDARAKLRVQPTERLDLLFTLARTEVRRGISAVNADAGRPRYYAVSYNTEEHDELDQNTAIARLDYYLTDAWTLTSLSTGTWAEYRALLDFDQGPDRAREALRKHEQRLAGEELRLGYEAERLTGFLGIYYGSHRNDIDDRIHLNMAGITDPALAVDGDVRIRNMAAFGEANWEVVDRWRLITGLRYDREHNDTAFNYTDPLGFATVPQAALDTSFHAWLPKVGISHDLTDDHLIGLVWHRGYRGGGVDLSTSTAHRPYDSEFTGTYELSWRGAWLAKKLRTSANLYHTAWKDQQVEVADENGIAMVANAARARMQGVELSVDYLVKPGLEAFLAASYNDTEYREFMLDGQDLRGQEFPYAPKYKATVGGHYIFTNGLQIGSDVVHQSDSVTLAYNDAEQLVERPNDRVTLVNLTGAYPLSDTLRLSCYVKNLFDRRYIVNNQDDVTMDVGAPRTFGIALRAEL